MGTRGERARTGPLSPRSGSPPYSRPSTVADGPTPAGRKRLGARSEESAPPGRLPEAAGTALSELRAVSAEEYRAIGRSCVDNDDWRAAYEAVAPGLAAHQRDVIEAYAATRLS